MWLRQKAIEELLEALVKNKKVNFTNIAQILVDGGKRTQGMDESEIYYDAADTMARMNTEDMVEFASFNLGQSVDEFRILIKDIQPLDYAQVTELEENLAQAYKQLRKSKSKENILRYLEESENELKQ